MIRLESLVTGYRDSHGTSFVSCPLSASLEDGKMTCLVGRNGVGKSTLLRTVAGIQKPVSGRVLFCDGKSELDISNTDGRKISSLISIVLTSLSGVEGFSAYDVVSMGRIPYTGILGTLGDFDRRIVSEAIALTGISSLAHKRFDSLSDGEKQKVMIAKSIAQQTPVILLDEPSAFLDYPSKLELMDMLRSLAHDQKRTVLLSSHDLDMVKKTADNFWMLSADGLAVSDVLVC